VVVATTTDPADEPVREISRRAGVRSVDGHPTDLLDRHYRAALTSGLSPESAADVVVKIPSDCPLIDPAAVDAVVGAHLREPLRHDFVSNLHPATWPDGNDVEVVPMPVLSAAWREARRPHEREHTTPFVWDQPHRFRVGNVRWETGLDYSMSHRFTIDYPEDYDFVRAVYDELWNRERPLFSLAAILDLLAARPDIFALNSRYAGVNWYRHHLDALATVGADQTRTPKETPI
jgi:spore coat polysaccharide biosynthesis protein SpsF